MLRSLAAGLLSLCLSLPSAARSLDAAADGSIGAKVNGKWLNSADYPSHQRQQTPFHDQLGSGVMLTIRHSGLAGAPDLVSEVRHYDDRSFTTILVHVDNVTDREIAVSHIRPFALPAGALTPTRILSDSYSEDTPVLRIRDFVPGTDYRAVGSQLLYDRNMDDGFFVGALTAKRWLTVIHLRPEGYRVDDEGTTELTSTKSLSPSRPNDHVVLKIAVSPGSHLDSELLLLAEGRDYLRTLRDYGEAVAALNGARTHGAAPWGWWSWTAYYNEISEDAATANATWLTDHLAGHGYDTLHLDEGYNATRGDYDETDPVRFPEGMERLARAVTKAGLRLGLWTAPFEVSRRSRVYRHHREWLVKNPQGEPIQIGEEKGDGTLYALDPTNPGAERHLRDTYRTLTRRWGVGYIKMDFMEMSSVEGVYYRRNTSAIEAQRIGLAIIRDAVGDDVILDKDGSAMLPPVGIVDAGRLSNDTEHSFAGTADAATGIAARFYMNGNFFTADPDAFCLSDHRSSDPGRDELAPLSFEEAKAAIALAAVAGGMFEDGDNLTAMADEPERLALMTNPDLLDMVRLRRAATPLDLMTYADEDLQPSLFWLRENDRQGILTVFNWTGSPRRHALPLDRLGLAGTKWRAKEIFGADGTAIADGTVIAEQPPHSVRVIRLTKD